MKAGRECEKGFWAFICRCGLHSVLQLMVNDDDDEPSWLAFPCPLLIAPCSFGFLPNWSDLVLFCSVRPVS